jgi:hypothetical protein
LFSGTGSGETYAATMSSRNEKRVLIDDTLMISRTGVLLAVVYTVFIAIGSGETYAVTMSSCSAIQVLIDDTLMISRTGAIGGGSRSGRKIVSLMMGRLMTCASQWTWVNAAQANDTSTGR